MRSDWNINKQAFQGLWVGRSGLEGWRMWVGLREWSQRQTATSHLTEIWVTPGFWFILLLCINLGVQEHFYRAVISWMVVMVVSWELSFSLPSSTLGGWSFPSPGVQEQDHTLTTEAAFVKYLSSLTVTPKQLARRIVSWSLRFWFPTNLHCFPENTVDVRLLPSFCILIRFIKM